MNSMDTDREAILALLDSYHNAMVAAQVNELERFLAPDFCLVHMTGYVQPKGEWLTVVSEGDFNYHAIEVDQSSLAVEINLSRRLATAGCQHAAEIGYKLSLSSFILCIHCGFRSPYQ